MWEEILTQSNVSALRVIQTAKSKAELTSGPGDAGKLRGTRTRCPRLVSVQKGCRTVICTEVLCWSLIRSSDYSGEVGMRTCHRGWNRGFGNSRTVSTLTRLVSGEVNAASPQLLALLPATLRCLLVSAESKALAGQSARPVGGGNRLWPGRGEGESGS